MRAGFAEMTAQECRERIAGGGVGRVAFCGPSGPEVYPVNFALVDGDVVFRTSPYTHLGTAVVGSRVVFEVDEVDHGAGAGWSVVVRGSAVAETDPDEMMRLRREGPWPWAEGQRMLIVRIHPTELTGRQVGPGH